MADLFDPPESLPPAAPSSSSSAGAASSLAGAEQPPAVRSPALERFETCRWRVVPPSGPAYCTHGEVLPYTGTSGFRAEAWCPDCRFYKMRRGARKQLGV